ncbi:M23 family metallopeptidase [candidate division KSB1 bacterium]|nr:M23 family metallopeptidase [candidate division KSB1 bacterium]
MFTFFKKHFLHTLPKHIRRKSIQVLIIPDDQAEPKHYRFSMRKVYFFRIVFVILVVHALVGVIAYYYLLRFMDTNAELIAVNNQLVENNKKVYDLVALFQKIEATDSKIRSALGLGENSQSLSIESHEFTPPQIREMATLLSSQDRIKPTHADLREKLGFLQQSENLGIHEYLKSVPTYLPVAGVLTNAYSESSGIGMRAPHSGIDIAAPRGSFIRAAGDGVVIFAGWTQNLGNMIILYHGNGFFTYYGHNQRLLVQRNSVVRKGENIALLGSSGESSAPHLHFEIWKDGIPLNPTDYILAFSGM